MNHGLYFPSPDTPQLSFFFNHQTKHFLFAFNNFHHPYTFFLTLSFVLCIILCVLLFYRSYHNVTFSEIPLDKGQKSDKTLSNVKHILCKHYAIAIGYCAQPGCWFSHDPAKTGITDYHRGQKGALKSRKY